MGRALRPARSGAGLLHAGLPGVVLTVVSVLDLLNGQQPVLGLVVIAPLLAANLVGPRPTAVYAVAALLVAALLGLFDDLYGPGLRGAQWTRLALVAAGGVLAVGASRVRVRREARLADLLRVAEVAQRAILPPVPSSAPAVHLAAHYESAAREASIGGDFYAAEPTVWGVRLLVGDVRGKGLDAVRVAAVVLGAFRERVRDREDLAELVRSLDAAVRRVAGPEDFVTAAVAEVHRSGQLTLICCGHPEPLLVRQGQPVAVPPLPAAPPLGLGPDPRSLEQAVQLQMYPGDRLLLHTDGLTEARRPGDRAFFPAQVLVPPALCRGTLAEGLSAVREQLLTWTGGDLADDVALLAIQAHPDDVDPPVRLPAQHDRDEQDRRVTGTDGGSLKPPTGEHAETGRAVQKEA